MFLTQNLHLAWTSQAHCRELQDLISLLQKAVRAGKDRDTDDDYAILYGVYDKIVSHVLAEIGRDCRANGYHNVAHTKDAILRGEDFARIALDTGFIKKSLVVVVKLIMLFHDYGHAGNPVRQTTKLNMSNEEFAALQAARRLLDEKVPPLFVLHVVSGILGTTFAQGFLEEPLKRTYVPTTFVEQMVSIADIGGFALKSGYEDRPFTGFMEESLALVREKPKGRRPADFDAWIGRRGDDARTQIGFLQSVVEVRIGEVMANGILSDDKYRDLEKRLGDTVASLENLKVPGEMREHYLAEFRAALAS